ncbi:unnamed protein product, partial [Meganyctiphanes norvegica]
MSCWSWYWWWGWTALLHLCLVVSVQGNCPKACECKWRDGKETVSCPDADFIDIPRHLDPSTQVLDMRRNKLKILPPDSFVYTGLINLQKVWLTYCQLIHIERGAFRKLINVVEMDVSHNMLRSIPTESLEDLPGLREFRISNNALTYINATAFSPTKELVRLDLSHNKIVYIHKDAISNLQNLEVLKVDHNDLVVLSAEALRPLTLLNVLHLDFNPWDCNCHLEPISKLLKLRNVALSGAPHCSVPNWLENREWITLEEHDFICRPFVTSMSPQILRAAFGENVTLSCGIESNAETVISWYLDNELIDNLTESLIYRLMEHKKQQKPMRFSNLTIMEVSPEDEGTYRCEAENMAGSSHTIITLHVSHEIPSVKMVAPESVYVKGGVFAGVGMMGVFMLLVMAIVCRKRRRSFQRRQSEDKVSTPICSSSINSGSPDHPLAEYQIVPGGEINDTPSSTGLEEGQPWLLGEPSHGYAAGLIMAETNLGNTEIIPEPPDGFKNNQSNPMCVTYPEGMSLPSMGQPGCISFQSNVGRPICESSSRIAWPQDTVVVQQERGGGTVSTVQGKYPDLLDLPQHGGTLAYCTMPRRSATGRAPLNGPIGSPARLMQKGKMLQQHIPKSSNTHADPEGYRS